MMSSFLLGTTRPWNISQTHAVSLLLEFAFKRKFQLIPIELIQNCVKVKAVASIMVVRKELSSADAWAIVDKVFDKCYNDLEPLGRRLRARSDDIDWVYKNRFHYNYDS